MFITFQLLLTQTTVNSMVPCVMLESGQDGTRVTSYKLSSRLADAKPYHYTETSNTIRMFYDIFTHIYLQHIIDKTYNCYSLRIGLDKDLNTIGNYTGL